MLISTLTRPWRSARGRLLTTLIAMAFLASCAREENSVLAPLDAIPDYAQNADERVQIAYRYAVNNQAEMMNHPCYCGCVGMGHDDLYACFASGHDLYGRPEFDAHAFGCGVCIDITEDVMNMRADGHSSLDIRRFVDDKYGDIAPGTNTPMPTE